MNKITKLQNLIFKYRANKLILSKLLIRVRGPEARPRNFYKHFDFLAYNLYLYRDLCIEFEIEYLLIN